MVWQAAPHLASFACGGWSAVVAGLYAADAVSYLKKAYPHPPASGNRLLSFTMKSTSCRAPGTVTFGKNSLIFGCQWILAILAPSGKGWPFSGIPASNALIIAGLPRITAVNFAF